MLSPIDLRTAALLVGSHPREPVFHAILSEIVFRQVSTNKAFALINDPTGDQPGYDCPDRVKSNGTITAILVNNCNYSMFLNYLAIFIDGGLTVELSSNGAIANKNTRRSREQGLIHRDFLRLLSAMFVLIQRASFFHRRRHQAGLQHNKAKCTSPNSGRRH